MLRDNNRLEFQCLVLVWPRLPQKSGLRCLPPRERETTQLPLLRSTLKLLQKDGPWSPRSVVQEVQKSEHGLAWCSWRYFIFKRLNSWKKKLYLAPPNGWKPGESIPSSGFPTAVVKMIIVTLKVLLLFFPLVFVVKIKISYKYINSFPRISRRCYN